MKKPAVIGFVETHGVEPKNHAALRCRASLLWAYRLSRTLPRSETQVILNFDFCILTT
jgi:hypothetical protein